MTDHGSNATNRDNGGPAFPVDFDHQTFKPKDVDEAKRLMSGMPMRDYFAAKAMQGLLSSEVQASPDEFATYAYQMADCMLKARQS